MSLRSLFGGGYQLAHKTVVITGGSRGLGLELARAMLRERARVTICARTAEDVTRAVKHLRASSAGAEVIGIPCDVTSEEGAELLVAHVEHAWGGIDVLINNAGIMTTGPAAHMTEHDYRAAMETHFWGPFRTIRAVLPAMKSKGGGRIVNIVSVGGKLSVPHMLPYSASKFALSGFSEGLRSELLRDNIAVTTVYPGLLRTGSPMNVTFKGRHRAEYAWFTIGDSLPGLSMSSQKAARKIVRACKKGQAHLVLGGVARLGILAQAVMPGLFAGTMALANRLLPAYGGRGADGTKGYESESAWSESWLTLLTRRAAVRNLETVHEDHPDDGPLSTDSPFATLT